MFALREKRKKLRIYAACKLIVKHIKIMIMKTKRPKLYKAIFRDIMKNELYTQTIIAYSVKQAREHAKNILAQSMRNDAKSVIVEKLY